MLPSTAVHEDAIASLIDAIAARGHAAAPRFADDAMVAALRARALALDKAGLFAPSAVGRGAGRIERADIRGDRIAWLDRDSHDRGERALFGALEALRLAANRALQLGLFDFEGHYAIYPAGRGYARHRDRFRDDDARVLSVVLYLNDRWRADEGGALRLHLPLEGAVDLGVHRLDECAAGAARAWFDARIFADSSPRQHRRFDARCAAIPAFP